MYKIGEFAKLVNIPVQTLRYYDEINLFKPSYTEPFTNYRYYEDKQIEEINYIKKLKELNLSLNEIMTYVKSKDISILKNKSFETNEKLDVLNDYIDDEIYTVKKEIIMIILKTGVFYMLKPILLYPLKIII